MISFDKLSSDGQDIAYNTVAFNALRNAAMKASADVARELKAIDERPEEGTGNDIPGYNEFRGEERGDELETEHVDEIGITRKVTLAEYVALAVAANDETETKAAGAKWPRPQSAAGVLDYLAKQTTARNVAEDEVQATIALVQANTGKTIPIDDARALAQAAADEKAAFFAQRIILQRELVQRRLEEAMANISTYDSFETVFGNLPDTIKLGLLRSIDGAINAKCNELVSGSRRGVPSPVVKIPTLVRASMVAVLRDDQKQVQGMQQLLAHAEAVAA